MGVTDGQSYNVNADTAAGAVAAALGASRLLLLTDVVGVLDRTGTLIQARAPPCRVRILCAAPERSAAAGGGWPV